MPPQTPQFDPLVEYRKQYDDPRPDAEIAKKLEDPSNFQKAFPHFDYSDPDVLVRAQKMMVNYNQRYVGQPGIAKGDARPTNATTPKVPLNQPNATWDRISNTWIPEALATVNKIGNRNLIQAIQGQPNLEDVRQGLTGTAKEVLNAPAGSGYAKDTATVGAKVASGVADFAFSPFGLANEGIAAATGGASIPWQAAAFSASMAPGAVQATKAAIDNPSPQNIQDAALQASFVAATGGGAKMREGMTQNMGYKPTHAMFDPESQTVKFPANSSEPSKATAKGPETTKQQNVDATSTQMGPRDSSKQTAPQVDATVQAPQEARAQQATSFVGKSSPMRPYDPNGNRFAKGNTIGMDPINPMYNGEAVSKSADIKALVETQSVGPTPEAPQSQFKLSTDSMGVKWAADDKGYKVSIPSRIAAADVDAYAAPKLEEQAQIHASILAKAEPKPIEPTAAAEVKPTIEEMKAEIAKLQAVRDTAPAPIKAPDYPVAAKSWGLPDNLRRTFDLMADNHRALDMAATDDREAELRGNKERLASLARGQLVQHLRGMGDKDVTKLRDTSRDEGTKLAAQGGAIRDLTEATVRNRGIKKEIADLRSPGGPVRRMVDPNTGERMTMKPDSKVSRGGRSVLDELQGRKPTSDFENLKVNAKPEGVSDQEWTQHVDTLQNERRGLKRKISDAVQIAFDTQSSLADAGVEEHVDRLKEIESMLGKYVEDAKTGRRPNVPAELDENGAIKAPEQIKSWSLDRANLAFGKTLRAMPSDEEFFQEADVRDERARLLHTVADVADGLLKKRAGEKIAQRGSLGDNAVATQERPLAPAPKGEDLVKSALKQHMNAWSVTDKKPAGFAGWLSPDGKHWLDKGNMTHEDAADQALFHTGGLTIDPSKRLLESGWVRKVNPRAFEVRKITRENVAAIEMSTIQDRVTGRDILMDIRGADGRMKSINISPGWENLNDAIRDAQRSMNRGQFGKLSGPVLGASASAGMLTGAATGMHLAGDAGALAGGAIGFVTGFVVPAILDNAAIRNSIAHWTPSLRAMGLPLKEFLVGKQQLDVGSPDMQQILRMQAAHVAGDSNWAERLKRFPAQVYKGVDPFAYIADKRNMSAVGGLMMKFDADGKVFRNLNLPDKQSLYVALRMAAGSAMGQREYMGLMYNDIKHDASEAGLRQALDAHLNLKAYQRVYDVLKEHMDDLNQNEKTIRNNLGNPQNTLVEIAKLNDQLKDVTRLQNEIGKKISTGKAAPNGYSPAKIQTEMNLLRNQLGPDRFKQVEDLTDRTFKSRADILDLLHSNGILSMEDYLTYKRRGDEYVPMDRIMDDLAERKQSTAAQPLHLRQQNVIKMLEGSERINVNPWQAFGQADRRAFNHIVRNETMGQLVTLVKTYPQALGAEIREVNSNYRAKADEGILGHYVDGKPQLYAAHAYLADTMEKLPAATRSAVAAAANWYGHAFKRAATVGNLGFQISSFLTHAMTSAVLPESGLSNPLKLPVEGAKFLGTWGRAVKEVVTKGQLYREMVRSGAAFGTMQRNIDPEYFANPSELGWKQKIIKGQFLDTMQDMASNLENINRTNTYMRSRQNGANMKEAAWETKQFGGAPDFSRLGDLSQPINQMLMFFNAANQYTHQAISGIRKDPMRVGALLIASTAAMIGLNQWNASQKDQEGNDLYRKIDPYTRQRNWVVLTGLTYHNANGSEMPYTVNIPKAKLFQLLNPVEDLINIHSSREARTGTQQALDSLSNISPVHLRLREGNVGSTMAQSIVSSLHPLAKTAIEQYSNTDEYGHSIVPASQTKIEPSQQYGPSTSQAAIHIGQGGFSGAATGAALGGVIGTMFGGYEGTGLGTTLGAGIGRQGVSPRRLDAGMRSMFAGAGPMAQEFVNPFLSAVGKTKQPPTGADALRATPIIGSVLKRFTSSGFDAQESEMSNRFYDAVNKAQIPANTLDALMKRDPEQAKAYMFAHKDDLFRAQIATAAAGIMKEINQQIESVKESNDPRAAKVLEVLNAKKLEVLKRVVTSISEAQRPGQTSTQPGAGQGGAKF